MKKLIILLLICFEIKVRTTDLDRNNHVNNAKFIEYIQESRWDYFKNKGINYDSLKKNDTILVVANININYIAEAKEDEILNFIITPEYIGEKSFKLRQLIFCNNKLITDARVTIVPIDTISKRPKKIPTDLIKILK